MGRLYGVIIIYLLVSSSSSEGPMAMAESQNFCIMDIVVSFPAPPLFSTFIDMRKRNALEYLVGNCIDEQKFKGAIH